MLAAAAVPAAFWDSLDFAFARLAAEAMILAVVGYGDRPGPDSAFVAVGVDMADGVDADGYGAILAPSAPVTPRPEAADGIMGSAEGI